MSGFCNNSVNSACFLSLPNEILQIIVDYLIISSCLPSSEIDLIPSYYTCIARRKSFNQVNLKNIFYLKNTHPLLRDFIYSRFNSQVCAVFKRLPNTNFVKESNDLFTFDKNYDYKQFDVVPEFFVSTEFYDLKNIRKIWVSEADPGLPAFFGPNWMKGVLESPARNLTSIVFDLKITTYLFEYGQNKAYSLSFDEGDEKYQKNVLKNIDYNDFPPFLEKALKSQNFYNAYREYKLQKLFDSLAKLISLQNVLPAVTIIDINGFVLQIVSLLWSFQKYNVSDSVRKLDLTAFYFPSPYDLFASYLAGLKKLEDFWFEFFLGCFQDHDNIPMEKTLSVLHEMSSLKHLKLLTNYSPTTPILFPENVKRLQITDTALMRLPIKSLTQRLFNVVELTLKFVDTYIDYYDDDPALLKIPNLKTLILNGKITSNLRFIGFLFKANPTITSASIRLTVTASYIAIAFRMMENVECVDIFIHPELQELIKPRLSHYIIPSALQCLLSLSTLIFNSPPFSIPLDELITYITEPEEDVATNLTTIIIYSELSVPVDGDHRDMFFTYSVSDYYFKGIHVSDFAKLIPVTTNPPAEKVFSSQKLIIDVVKLRNRYKKVSVTTDQSKLLV